MKAIRNKSVCVYFCTIVVSLFFLYSGSMAQELAAEFAQVEKVEKSTGELLETALQARETNDLKLVAEILKETSENSDELARIAPIAKDQGVVQLCQKVMNAAKRIEVLLGQMLETAMNVLQTSTDPTTVEEAKQQIEQIKQIQDQNANTIQISLACGAVPTAEAFEPPERTDFGPAEPPIEDNEPGSAI